MRKLVVGMMFSVLAACTSGDRPAEMMRRAVERQMRDYPASTLRDLYKSFFQERFGPGHIVSDTIAADNYLCSELDSAEGYAGAAYEPTGCDGGFYRVSLEVIADGRVPYDRYFDAFMRSVRDVEPVEVEHWRTEWLRIMEVVSEMSLELPDYAADSVAIMQMLDQGGYASHHSRAYNELYRPHYRLIRKDIFEKELLPLIEGR